MLHKKHNNNIYRILFRTIASKSNEMLPILQVAFQFFASYTFSLPVRRPVAGSTGESPRLQTLKGAFHKLKEEELRFSTYLCTALSMSV